MKCKNLVYIACSLDGFIADNNGGLDWLDSIEIPEGEDMGYNAFMERVDALLIGRTTFETVLGFDIDWPYQKPVFVLSNSLKEIPESHKGKAHLTTGHLPSVLKGINDKGYLNLYIDGGKTIQSLLAEDLIDEMIITRFPILLGSGVPLFTETIGPQEYQLVESRTFANNLVQSHYVRNRH